MAAWPTVIFCSISVVRFNKLSKSITQVSKSNSNNFTIEYAIRYNQTYNAHQTLVDNSHFDLS